MVHDRKQECTTSPLARLTSGPFIHRVPAWPLGRILDQLDIYGKGEQEDLSAADKRFLKDLAEEYKREAIRSAQTKETP